MTQLPFTGKQNRLAPALSGVILCLTGTIAAAADGPREASKQETRQAEARHVVVRPAATPTASDRTRLASEGVTILEYAGEGCYFATLSLPHQIRGTRPAGIRAISAIEPSSRLHPALRNGATPPVAVVGADAQGQPIVAVYILFHADVPHDAAGANLVASHGGTIRSPLRSINGLVIELPRSNLDALATEDGVLWIEPPLPPLSETNDHNRLATQVEEVQTLPDYGLTGAGVSVMVYDVGGALESHPDFGTRVQIRDGSVPALHSTHVAGTVAGDGFASGGLWRGMAPSAEVVSYGFAGSGNPGAIPLYNDPGDLESDYADAFENLSTAVANNSIGTNICANGFECALTGAYGVTDQLVDAMIAGSLGRTVRVVWAAGNERSCDRCSGEGTRRSDGYGSIPPPSGAKNPICVGATNGLSEDTAAFSSWGPTADGRLKPDLIAPGCQLNDDFGITSTAFGGSYTVLCGSSMAAPTVSGIVALLLEAFRTRFPSPLEPSNAMIKAVLLHTALDVQQDGPDYRSGYGLVQARDAIDFLRIGGFLESDLGEGDSLMRTVRVAPGAAELKVTLIWDDAPALPMGGSTLINDLDVHVIGPDGVRHFPQTLDPERPNLPATTDGPDRINNVEQVRVPTPTPGLWTVTVHGFAVPDGPQSFALCLSPQPSADCDENGISDAEQIAADPSLDCGDNGVLDICEPDCDADAMADSCELATGAAGDCDRNLRPDGCDAFADCNANGVFDACEVADGTAPDCDGNGVPDECQPDCDHDGVTDACALLGGQVEDCNLNGVPDSCENPIDCNANGTDDGCDIILADSQDTNVNGIPDECEPVDTVWHVDTATCPAIGDGTVQSPFCTIQNAIDRSLSGHSIVVAPGQYAGPRNRNLDFGGRLIHLRSTDPEDDAIVASTVIDGSFQGRGFYFHNGEGPTARVSGFTIRRGLTAIGSTPDPLRGGAIYCRDSHPTFRRCRIIESTTAPTIFFFLGGAGVYCERSSPTFERCTIAGNATTSFGGGVYCFDNAHPIFRDCLILDNVAFSGAGLAAGIDCDPLIERCSITDNMTLQDGSGGGMVLFARSSPTLDSVLIARNQSGAAGGAIFTQEDCDPRLMNTTLVQNVAAGPGGASLFTFRSAPTFSNSILWDNTSVDGSAAVVVESNADLLVEHSLLQGGLEAIEKATHGTVRWGLGNIDADPLFVDSAAGSFSLLAGSPAVNGGNPQASIDGGATDISGLPRVQECRVDIGAYESPFLTDCNGNEASDSCEVLDGTVADCDADGVPDECQNTFADCNENGLWDACDILEGIEADCNANLVPDACELADPQDLDCNANGLLDECDISAGTSSDINENGTPDECESCESDEDCSDGVFCSGFERCVDHVCIAGSAPCPGQVCVEASQTCFNCVEDADCEDGNACTVRWCNHGHCETETIEGPCNDALACTVNDVCVEGFCRGNVLSGCSITYSIRAVAVDGVPLPEGATDQVTLYNASTVTLEIFLEGWAPDGVRLYNVAVDGSGYTSGPHGSLTPVIDPNPSAGAFIEQNREDFLFFGLTTIVAVFNANPDLYQWGGFVFFGEDCVTDETQPAYLGSLILATSADAAGSFLVCPNATDANHDHIPDNSFAARCDNENFIPVGFECVSLLVIADCNDNGIPDDEDIDAGTSQDCTGNGFPDECEVDCNNNASADSCDILFGAAADCNGNAIPDACDLASSTSQDCDLNLVPDECETDCNANGITDACDIAEGTSEDCDGFGVPDECEDCNGNGVGDLCDLAQGVDTDCNDNEVLDGCDLESGASQDCDQNDEPDECQDTSEDCNLNGIWDACDRYVGAGFDCNDNGLLDECDLASGQSTDCDGNLLPDECFDYFPTLIDPTRFTGVRGLTLRGFREDARTGGSFAGAGDLNDDGFDDFVVGADNATVAGITSAGEAYVVFGHPHPWTAALDLAITQSGIPGEALAFRGESPDDLVGGGLGGGGDFNGDGVDDLLIGAWGADPNDLGDAGEVYLVFGDREIDTRLTLSRSELNGTNGFILRGAFEGDLTGQAVAFAGDVNSDGLDDVLISAHTASPGDRAFAGRAYVLFGTALPQSTVFDLATLLPKNGGDGSIGFVVNGVAPSDLMGSALAGANDVNGDGFADMLFGAHSAGPNGQLFAGQAYLVFGGADVGAGGVIELAELNGQTGVLFNGVDAVDLSGHHVAPAGDINADGYADFLNGAVWADPGGRASAGETYLTFGHADPWPAVVELASLLPENGGDGTAGVVFNGINPNDLAGFRCTGAGDVNTDDIDDILIGAFGAAPDGVPLAGEAYVLFGHPGVWPAAVELSGILEPVAPEASVGFVVRGKQENGRLGSSVSALGDVNGDGAGDIGIGLPGALRDDFEEVGKGHLMFGRHIEPRDCNNNGTLDQCDILNADSTDCDADNLPDECIPEHQDCDGNGLWDRCDLNQGRARDCNENGVPDKCELLAGTSSDCNANSLPDECEVEDPPDCNANGVWDVCDLLAQFSPDCNDSGIPDECEPGGTEDCNINGVPDLCDVHSGFSLDRNANAKPDECEPHETIHVDASGCDLVSGGTGSPDDPFCRIQDGVDAAGTGTDRVIDIIVADGTYTGEGNREIVFNNGLATGTRAVRVHSANGPDNCLIDCGGVLSAFALTHGETRGTRIEGFTIIDARSGAFRCANGSHPVIENCTVTRNFRISGGAGVRCVNSSPIIRRCRFSGNTTNAIQCRKGSSPLIQDCLIVGNRAVDGAGVHAIEDSHPTIYGCTIARNRATNGAGALALSDSTLHISDSIVYANLPDSIHGAGSLRFTDIEGGHAGVGNIDEDPRFTVRATGSWTADPMPTQRAGQYALTDSAAQWTPGSLAGAYVNTAINGQVALEFPVVANTESTLTIWGEGWGLAATGTQYEVVDYRLEPKSPCINAADIAVQPTSVPRLDAANQERVQHCRMDMGAFETAIPIDCDDNGMTDACEVLAGAIADCNTNFVPDGCEPDCDANGEPDPCEVLTGRAPDVNSNEIPDVCEFGLCDLNGDRSVDEEDRDILIACAIEFDPIGPECPNVDLNGDGAVNGKDVHTFLECFNRFTGRELLPAIHGGLQLPENP